MSLQSTPLVWNASRGLLSLSVVACYTEEVNADAYNPAMSPEPIDLLVAATPPRILLDFVKADEELSRNVLQGFSARANAMANPVVRQRIVRAVSDAPALTQGLFETWLFTFVELMQQLSDPRRSLDLQSLRPLLKEVGEAALRYGLLHTEREDARAWAERIEEIRQTTPKTITDDREAVIITREQRIAEERAILRSEMTELKRSLAESEKECARLQREVARLEKHLHSAEELETSLRQLLKEREEAIKREQRRVRGAEAEADKLEKALRKLEQQIQRTTTEPVSPSTTRAIENAIAILQKSIQKQPPVAEPAIPGPPSPPPVPVATRKAPPPTPREPSVSLPTSRGEETLTISRIQTALRKNDMALIGTVRDGIARLAGQQREQMILHTLEKAGIPVPVLTGPLRPAFIDGSNIANMSPERRAHLAYLQEVRQSAWNEGYFPVIIIVDASLKHQIDQPDALMTLVETGEIRMAQPGTSADELLITEALQQHAVLLTNDRMTNWPAAKPLEMRHVELHRGKARVGAFHRSSWLPW
ncbi:MAG: NYN domain-containing protein [Armatimonadota bacterium]